MRRPTGKCPVLPDYQVQPCHQVQTEVKQVIEKRKTYTYTLCRCPCLVESSSSFKFAFYLYCSFITATRLTKVLYRRAILYHIHRKQTRQKFYTTHLKIKNGHVTVINTLRMISNQVARKSRWCLHSSVTRGGLHTMAAAVYKPFLYPSINHLLNALNTNETSKNTHLFHHVSLGIHFWCELRQIIYVKTFVKTFRI